MSQFAICKVLNRTDTFTMQYLFYTPAFDKNIEVSTQTSLGFWNKTATAKYCWMKYTGPGIIMTNVSNNCYQELQDHWHIDQGNPTRPHKYVMNHPCLIPNKQIKVDGPLYTSNYCKTQIKPSSNYINMISSDTFYKIYCYTQNITIGDEILECPDYPFEVSHTVDFTLNEQRHQFQRTRKTLVDPISININKQVNSQLNLTALRISSANITKLEQSYSRLGRFTKSLNKNITLESLQISDTLKAPLKKASHFLRSSIELLEQGAMLALG